MGNNVLTHKALSNRFTVQFVSGWNHRSRSFLCDFFERERYRPLTQPARTDDWGWKRCPSRSLTPKTRIKKYQRQKCYFNLHFPKMVHILCVFCKVLTWIHKAHTVFRLQNKTLPVDWRLWLGDDSIMTGVSLVSPTTCKVNSSLAFLLWSVQLLR